MRTIVLAGLLASSLLGCGSDDPAGGGGAGATGGDQGGGGGGAAPDCAPVASPEVTDVSGRWAYRAVGSQITRPQGLSPITTRIISVMLFEQQQSGDAITASGTYCDHYTEDPGALVHAVIPESYLDALEDVTREGTFAAGSDGGRRYQLARLYEVVGAELADVVEDELPTDPEDERIIDQDGDGHPGVTVRLNGIIDGEVYVAERKWTELDGVAVSADRIEGKLRFVSEQSKLAADPSSLEGMLAGATSSTDPEECNSTFQMVRVPDEADCDWIVEQADTLFE